MADISFYGKDSMRFRATPLVAVENQDVKHVDDTLYAQNMYVSFAGVTEGKKVKIGIKESDRIIDFVTLKAYIFPYINIVWLGLIIMGMGVLLSAIRRAKLSPVFAALLLIAVGAGLFYMFLFAN
jgi:cytochrome c-type biogenesis protein CcmF